jgi:hypothetical protein
MSSPPVPASRQIDVNIPRFSQAAVAVLTGLAFLAQRPWLVGITFLLLALARAFGPRASVFAQVYVRLVRPRLRGPTEFEDPRPPAFAQLLGSIFLGASTFALYAGAAAVGWALTLMVTALAALAATTRICVGCLVYEKAVRR